jgi:hypothetical protein
MARIADLLTIFIYVRKKQQLTDSSLLLRKPSDFNAETERTLSKCVKNTTFCLFKYSGNFSLHFCHYSSLIKYLL